MKPAQLRPYIPKALELETFGGVAWLGIVPFYLTIRPRLSFHIPRVTMFPELNVRTYVKHQDRAGVWFFSLDARNPLACWAARKMFYLSYYWARMSIQIRDRRVEYRSERRLMEATFVGDYAPVGEIWQARPGSLEHWLTERYCLFTQSPTGQLCYADVHHGPWQLQQAHLELKRNSMTQPLNLQLPNSPELLFYAPHIDVLSWPLRRLTETVPSEDLEPALETG